MHSRQLTAEQLRIIQARIQPLLGYLTRLERRMEHEGFPVDDRLYELTRDAQEAVERLFVELNQRASRGRGEHSMPMVVAVAIRK